MKELMAVSQKIHGMDHDIQRSTKLLRSSKKKIYVDISEAARQTFLDMR